MKMRRDRPRCPKEARRAALRTHLGMRSAVASLVLFALLYACGSSVTSMPDVSDAPPALAPAVAACQAGSSADCTRAGDHYFSQVPGPRGRQLYARAADLAWEATPEAAAGGARVVESQGDAVAVLRTAWPGVVASISEPSRRDWATAQSPRLAAAALGGDFEQIDAELEDCRSGFRWVHQLETEHDGSLRGAVLDGAHAALRRDERCWAVMFHGGMEGEILAYVARDGTLLAVTIVPEG